MSYTYRQSFVFVVGKPTSEASLKELLKENAEFNDIVFLNSSDSYNKLTYKTIAAFEYAFQRLPYFEFLVKVDDDTFLRVDRLMKFLEASPRNLFYAGKFQV